MSFIALTGTVSFFDGTTLLGTGTLSRSGTGAQGTFTTSTLSLGSHTITAVYHGDSNYDTSTSASLGEAVQQATSMTMLSSSSYSAAYGQAVTFTAQVYPSSPGSTPSGTVSYYDNGVLIATVTLIHDPMGYHTAFTSSSLSLGSHTITSVYSGDSADSGSSASITEFIWVWLLFDDLAYAGLTTGITRSCAIKKSRLAGNST